MFDRLAKLTTRWPKTIVIAAFIFIGVCSVFAVKATKDMQTAGYTNPNSQSAQAEALLQQKFAVGQPNLVLLVNAPSGIDDPAVSAEAKTLTAELTSNSQIIGVSSYWTTHSPLMRAKDGKSGLIVGYITGTQNQQSDVINAIEPSVDGKHGPVTVQIGGTAVVNVVLVSTVRHDIAVAERIGFPLTALVMILVFQSFIASFLPLFVGVVAALGTLAELRGLSSATSVSIFSISLATGLSTGLASDYGLFIVKRYRDEYHSGVPIPEAIRVTLNTAGRTVLYSSLTVTVAMCSLLVFPGYYLRSFGYTGITVVLLAALAALTVLPAALFLLGKHVDGLNPWKLLHLGRRRRPAGSASAAARTNTWQRIAEGVMRRPVLYALATIALLGVMIVPFVHFNFGLPDDRDLPASTESHVVQQTLRDDYQGQITNQLDVVANGISPTAQTAAISAYAARLSTVPDVVRVTAVTGVYADGRQVAPAGLATRGYATSDATYLAVASSANQDSKEGNAQVAALRAVPAPFPVALGGADADLVDTLAGMGSALPWAILIVAGASLTLIFLMTGGVLLAFKALLMNMLTLGATVGALVWVFQYGHFSSLLNFQTTNSLDVALLVLLFCVAFGVSMDFEVFLLSRIKEEYKRTGDNRAAIAFGISKTGSVVTAAASITSMVFLVIGVTANVTTIKMLGWGMALALILDATVIRSTLVPALMRLLGNGCWWRPAFMNGLYQRFRLHDEQETERGMLPGTAAGLTPAAGNGANGRSAARGHGSRAVNRPRRWAAALWTFAVTLVLVGVLGAPFTGDRLSSHGNALLAQLITGLRFPQWTYRRNHAVPHSLAVWLAPMIADAVIAVLAGLIAALATTTAASSARARLAGWFAGWGLTMVAAAIGGAGRVAALSAITHSGTAALSGSIAAAISAALWFGLATGWVNGFVLTCAVRRAAPAQQAEPALAAAPSGPSAEPVQAARVWSPSDPQASRAGVTSAGAEDGQPWPAANNTGDQPLHRP